MKAATALRLTEPLGSTLVGVKMLPGYSYRWNGHEWEIVYTSDPTCRLSRAREFVYIDDAKCVEFEVRFLNRVERYAQTLVMVLR